MGTERIDGRIDIGKEAQKMKYQKVCSTESQRFLPYDFCNNDYGIYLPS